MSPQGCLTGFFILLIAIWSLFIAGLVAAGWLSAEILEFLVGSVLADAASARHMAQRIVETLRSFGFSVFAAIWAIGTGLLGMTWFIFWRGAGAAEPRGPGGVFENSTDTFPPVESLKDVTPRRDGTPRDAISPPDRPQR
jgi:hypothetical protein